MYNFEDEKAESFKLRRKLKSFLSCFKCGFCISMSERFFLNVREVSGQDLEGGADVEGIGEAEADAAGLDRSAGAHCEESHSQHEHSPHHLKTKCCPASDEDGGDIATLVCLDTAPVLADEVLPPGESIDGGGSRHGLTEVGIDW